MPNYSYRTAQIPWLNQRFSVGQKVTASQMQQIIQACNALSAMRWSASCYLGTGFTFTSSYLHLLVPTAGSGRQIWQPYFAAASASSLPAYAYLYTMAGGYTLGSTSSTATNFSLPSQSGYTVSKIFSAIYASSYAGITYRTPASYGCGRLRLGTLTATSPLTFGVLPYGPGYTYNEGVARYCASNGTLGSSWAANSQVLPQLNAGMLRACEEMLDTAETMPIPICMMPWWTDGTVTAPNNVSYPMAIGGVQACNFARWVPIYSLTRKRALWVAIYGSQSALTNTRIYWTVNEYSGGGSTLTASAENVVYVSGRYVLMAIPLEGMLRSNKTVADMPMHYIKVSFSNVQGASAWVGDMP